MKHRFTASALRELNEAALYYEEARAGLGEEFIDEVTRGVAWVCANPLASKKISPEIRRYKLHRFPFGLVYKVRTDEVLVASVLDLRRDSQNWRWLLR